MQPRFSLDSDMQSGGLHAHGRNIRVSVSASASNCFTNQIHAAVPLNIDVRTDADPVQAALSPRRRRVSH